MIQLTKWGIAVLVVFIPLILRGSCETTLEALPGLSADFPYGVVYPYPPAEWTEADRLPIRTRLADLRAHGVNTTVQVFSSRLIGSGREEAWLIFLDEAEDAGIRVVAQIYPADRWNGSSFDLSRTDQFLAVVRHHPAVYAYLGLHEPLEVYTTAQLQSYYSAFKALAPELPLAHYMGNMAWFEDNARFPDRAMTTGVCDVCIAWYYPARIYDSEPIFLDSRLRAVLQANRQLLDTRAPDSQLWFLGQTFTYTDEDVRYRMPVPEEMGTMFRYSIEEGVDGFLWYPFLHGLYQEVLSDEAMVPQMEAARTIYECYSLGAGTHEQ